MRIVGVSFPDWPSVTTVDNTIDEAMQQVTVEAGN